MEQVNIGDILAIGIVGTGASILVEWIQNKYGTGSNTTKAIVIALSVLVGTGYYFVRSTPLWLPIVGILGMASTVYAFFFSGKPTPQV